MSLQSDVSDLEFNVRDDLQNICVGFQTNALHDFIQMILELIGYIEFVISVANQAFAFDIQINQKAMYAKDPVEQNLFVTQVISNVS